MVEKLKSEEINVTLACDTFEVSRSGFYAWQKRDLSAREVSDLDLLSKIKIIFEQSRKTYGSPRIFEILHEDGVPCSEKRVARIMKENDIISCTHKKFKPVTTDSKHSLPIADRVFESENASEVLTAPNQVWVSDITYVETKEGWLYLAIFLDVFSRKIVGFSSDNHMRAELVTDALMMALGRQDFNRFELIAHSDRGSQYASNSYCDLLKDVGIIRSMSRKANCYDNAFAETFFHSLKMEMIYQTKFATREEAKQAIFEYIEVFYNRERRHSSIGYMTPENFENEMLAA
jgi:transposase InsO family protein